MRESATDEGVFIGPRPTGQEAIFSFLRLRLAPDRPPYLTIVITSALSEAYANADTLLYRGLALAGVATLLALGIARLLGEAAIGRGLTTLGAAIARLAGGDLAARVDASPEPWKCSNLAAISTPWPTSSKPGNSNWPRLPRPWTKSATS